MAVSLSLLKQQDSKTSNAVIDYFSTNSTFAEFSKQETDAIIQRDKEDGVKLQVGIDLAIAKGVIPAKVDVEPITKIDVMGKSPEEVVDRMLSQMGDAARQGCVMTLQGFSGTGKGTTVQAVLGKLPNATAWSNGNVFRSLTLLATTYADQKACDLSEALSPDNLASFVSMLTFGQFNGKFDVKIEGLGLNYMVSEIQNTVLKSSAVGSKIPTVAEVTQGEVICFVQQALKIMTDAGCSVLLEGREQTLNYIRTPYRFELILGDPLIIGKRRAAQKLSAAALQALQGKEPSPAEIDAALQAALTELAK